MSSRKQKHVDDMGSAEDMSEALAATGTIEL